jgi:23S rRNA (pseudouridine1915-N3)-methyltransferase
MSSFRCTIICVGKLKERAYKELELEFLKRLSSVVFCRIIELPDVSYETSADILKAQEEEALAILKHIPPAAVVIALSEDGQLMSSVEFADIISKNTTRGEHLVFIIGGSSGLSKTIKQQVRYLLSFGRVTLTHNFARVLLAEQIYRATKILAGSDYHK